MYLYQFIQLSILEMIQFYIMHALNKIINLSIFFYHKNKLSYVKKILWVHLYLIYRTNG